MAPGLGPGTMQVRILSPPKIHRTAPTSFGFRPGCSRAAIARRSCTRLLSGRGRFDSVGRRSLDPSPSQEGRRPFKPPGGGSNPSRSDGDSMADLEGKQESSDPARGALLRACKFRERSEPELACESHRSSTGAGREVRHAAVDRVHVGSNPAPQTIPDRHFPSTVREMSHKIYLP